MRGVYFNGPIPDGLLILHKCDIRQCVNPSHLFLGTYQDNMDDKCIKGCDRNGCERLTVDQVQEIRQSPLFRNTLGRKYGVSPQAIHKIRHFITWKKVVSVIR